MISQMLSRNPSDRPSFDRILSSFRGSIFPEYFYTFLKDYSASLSELPETTEAAFLQRSATQPGTKVDRLLSEWESISVHLESAGKGVDESEWILYVAADPRRSGPATAQFRLFLHSQLSVAIFPPAWPTAVPQSVPVPARRRQG